MSSWNLRPKLTDEQKAKEARVDALRKEFYGNLSKHGWDFYIKQGINAAEITRQEIEKQKRARLFSL
jgi:hypothetical protein